MVASIAVGLCLLVLVVSLTIIVGGVLVHAGLSLLRHGGAPPPHRLAPARLGRDAYVRLDSLERLAAWLLLLFGLGLPAVGIYGVMTTIAAWVEGSPWRGPLGD